MTDLKNDQQGYLNMSRRQFLGLSAAGVGATALAAIPLSKDPLYDADFPHVTENHVKLSPNGKRVCILGGGLAGIQAGVELAARGFKVTILERSGYPGGKLKTWRDKTFGPDDHPLKKDPGFRGVVREHGAHGIWGSYKNLREFMGRYGFKTESVPDHSMDYLFLDKNGKKIRFTDSALPAPYDRFSRLLELFAIEQATDTHDVRVLLGALVKMLSFKSNDDAEIRYLDGVTFAAYAKSLGISDALIKSFFGAIAHMAYYDTVENISALAMVQAIRMSSSYPRDAKISLFMSPAGETFLQPMVDFIRRHDGEVFYNQDVSELIMKNDRVSGVRTRPVTGGMRVRRCQVCGELIYGDEDHGHCPFCGADAPQLKDLDFSEKRSDVHESDYFVVAMDVPGLQKFVVSNQQALGHYGYFKNILNMTSRPVWLVNYWIPASGFWEKHFMSCGSPLLTFTPTGTQKCGVTFNWTLPFRDEQGNVTTLIRDYARHDVTIIECHLAQVENFFGQIHDTVAREVFDEMKTLIPGIPDYADFYVNRWNNYTGVRVGERALRPGVQSPVDNLLLIGDLVNFHGVELGMEKTNITAKIATNILLDKIGQQEGAITILESGTPNLVTNLYQRFATVYP